MEPFQRQKGRGGGCPTLFTPEKSQAWIKNVEKNVGKKIWNKNIDNKNL